MLTFLYLAAIVAIILQVSNLMGGRMALWFGWMFGIYLLDVHRTFMIPGLGQFFFYSQSVVTWTLTLLIVGGSIDRPSYLRFGVCDGLMVAMYLSAITTLTLTGMGGVSMLVTYGGYYLTPYLVGRYFLSSTDDLRRALHPVLACISILCAFLVLEFFTGLNVFSWLMSDKRAHPVMRNGFYRANGPLVHSDGAGWLLVTSLPFLVAARRLNKLKLGAGWWKLAPWLLGAGLLATNSRGPWIAAAMTIGISIFFSSKLLRLPILGVACALLTILLVAPQVPKEILHKIGDDVAGGANYGGDLRIVVIDGKEEIYTGTEHRWLLSRVYAEPLRRVGLFGFGLRSPADLLEDETLQRVFWSIDNYYMVLRLLWGNCGYYLFIAIEICAPLFLVRAALRQKDPVGDPMAGTLIGCLAGTAAMLWGLSLLNDMRSPWSFMIGLSASLAQMLRNPQPIPGTAGQASTPTTQGRALPRWARPRPAGWNPAPAPAPPGPMPGPMPMPRPQLPTPGWRPTRPRRS